MREGEAGDAGRAPAEPGASVGPYVLVSVAGRGGCGTVWRAERREPFRQAVAVKLIRPGMGSDAVLARFAQERRALARMDHPNIARVIDGGATPEGQPYFVMEFVDGEPITSYCDRVRMPLGERALLLAQACDAVQHAHQRGIIHRDLKPSNILVAEDERGAPRAKVIDFGIAKALSPDGSEPAVTEVGEIVGTPDYMSPEQADLDGARIDTRTDVWGLGAVLHELACGAPPYGRAGEPAGTDATGRASTLRAARAGDVRRIATRADEVDAAAAAARGSTHEELARALRGELGWIPMRAMRARPEDRYQSPAELAGDLRAWAAGGPLVAGPDTAAYRLRAYARTHRTQVVAAGAVAATLVAATAVSAWFAVHESRARGEVERRARETQRIADLQAGVIGALEPSFVGAAIVQDALDRHRDVMVRTEPDRERRRALMRTMYEEMIKLNKPDIGLAVIDRWLVTPMEKAVDERMADLPLAAASVRHGIAGRRWALGQLDEAERIAREVERVRADAIGPEAPETLATVHLLGMIAWSKEDHAEAVRRLEAAWRGRERALGALHADTVESAAQLGNALVGAGRSEDALAPLGMVLDAQRSAHGAESAQAYGAMRDLGLALGNLRRFDEALPLLRAAWEGRVRTIGPDAPGTVRAQAFLGMCLADAGQADEARTVLADALQRSERATGTEAPFTRMVRERIARLGAGE